MINIEYKNWQEKVLKDSPLKNMELAAGTSPKANVVDNMVELVGETSPKADLVDNMVELAAE